MSTLANNEDSDEMLQNAALHQGRTACGDKIDLQTKKYNISYVTSYHPGF